MFIANSLAGFRRKLLADFNNLVAFNPDIPANSRLAAPVVDHDILQ